MDSYLRTFCLLMLMTLKKREDRLTPEEMLELTQLHEEAMIPTQEEEDWMLLIDIKKERKFLAHLYWPNQVHYKIEDICDICKKDCQDEIYEVKNVINKIPKSVKPTLNCTKCKFKSTSKDSLKTHNKSIHEHLVFKCDQCPVCTLSEPILKKHINQSHMQKVSPKIKESLNFIKGEAGSLSNIESNDKRG